MGRITSLAAIAAAALALAGCPGSDGGDSGGGSGGGGTPARHGAGAGATPLWPQPERYALDLSYGARRFALAGSERITLRNSGRAPLRSVWLRTWGNAFGGCARRFVRVEPTAGARAGRERVGCTALELRLDAPLAPGARTTVALTIGVVAPPRPDRFGRYAGAAYFGNALPLLAVAAGDAAGPRLPPYSFNGESFFSLSARWRVRLRLPPGTRAATTGSSAGGVTTAVARDFMIVAGPLRLRERRAGAVTVKRWSVREPARDAASALRSGTRALTRYGRLFGPYGRAELDLVEGPRTVARGAGLGMEYPELVLTPGLARVVEHEVAHQWWYGIVGNDEYEQPWLDESFAMYAGLRLAGSTERCAPPRGRPPLTASMRTFEHGGRDAYSRIVYGGGPCALRTLERGLGRARFDSMLRTVVRTHRDGVLTTAAFVAAVRAAAPPAVDAGALLRSAGIGAPR